MQRQIYDIDRNAHCLCFHVRSATCFIGSIHLMITLLSIINYILNYNPEIDFHANTHNSIQTIDQRKHTNKLIILNIIAEFLKAFICTLLLYGVFKSKASYLVPFFLMQLFYFCRTISYFMEQVSTIHSKNCTNVQNAYVVVKFKQQDPYYPYNPIWFLASFLYKLYFICVVWKCYRYLKMKELVLPLHYVIRNRSNRTTSIPQPPPPPPDYDTVTKSAPPPDYNTVIKSLPPDYETAVQKQSTEKEFCNKDTEVKASNSDNSQQQQLQSQHPQQT